MSFRTSYHLLLVGLGGNGISATYDSILHLHGSSHSGIVSGSREIDGFTVMAVDGPSLEAPETEGEVKALSAEMLKALNQFEDGFDAVVLVLKFGVRFTTPQKGAVETLKNMLGPVLRDYVVCVVTCGEDFEKQMRRRGAGKTFSDWCHEQGGDFGELFKECEYRCVLFENESDEANTETKQVRELLDVVEALKGKHQGRYGKEAFQRAQGHRDRTVVEMKRSGLTNEVMTKGAEVQKGLNEAQHLLDRHRWYDAECELHRLQELVQSLQQRLYVVDNGTGVLNDLKNNAASLEKMIQLRRQIADRMKADEEQERKSEEVIEITNGERRRILETDHARRDRDSLTGRISAYIRWVCLTIANTIRWLWSRL